MNIHCPWCQASIEGEGVMPDKCPECGGIVQASGGFKFLGTEGDEQPEKATSKPVVAQCPICIGNIDYSTMQEGKIISCPHCLRRLRFSDGRFAYIPPAAPLVAIPPPQPKSRDPVTNRRVKIQSLRETSPWTGTRQFFGALAFLGVFFGLIGIIIGLSQTADKLGDTAKFETALNVLSGQMTILSGISSIFGSVALWLIVCLLADIADLLLKSGED